MANRSKAREKILQILYLMEQSGLQSGEAIDFFGQNFETHDEEMPFIRFRIEGIETHLENLDKNIASASKNWKIHRMPKIDRNILRLASFEMQHCEDIPHSVAINEAIELSKRFGEINSPKFINGILDRLAKELSAL
ncbi:MAG: transcription antitermination factor NusB [Bdellovibrionales bacterium]|nr:transcription antitermination factor NusB [Bdellovibrionales bacterium]